MLISIAQLNPIVGDIVGNATKLHQAWQEAALQDVDLVVCSEMVLTGYPPEDLTIRPSFIEEVRHVVEGLAAATVDGPGLLIGAPWHEEGRLYNAALLLSGGVIAAKTFKHDLPNYGCFDEKRIFSSGPLPKPIMFRGIKLGVMICEDMWLADVPRHLHQHEAQVFIVLNGSPYESDKLRERQAIARARVMETETPLIYVNLVGGQDELVFDGASFVLNAKGEVVVQASSFVEDVVHSDWLLTPTAFVPQVGAVDKQLDGPASQYRAVLLGLQDYALKNGFKDMLLGLSGGIDSALVAVLAVDAFGADHVHAVMLPSSITSNESIDDAMEVAKNLGCSFSILPITLAVNAFVDTFTPAFEEEPRGVMLENIQSRCRGLMLMGISNKFGHLLLATGNKSEMATGYTTIYGDMCGGFAPIKDLYKTDVYKVARYANQRNGAVIPEQIFTKAPSAELSPGQKDQDTLPPYDELDEILRGLIERDMSFAALIEYGYDLTLVKRVWSMVKKSEYKRRQAPPGPKVTRRHMGRDRRYPITNGDTGS